MDEDEIGNAAIEAVFEFIDEHRAHAIPALIGACVYHATQLGLTEEVKSSLINAVDLADRMGEANQQSAN